MPAEFPGRLPPLEILRQLVSFPTVSSDTNRPLIDWVATYLASHDIEHHIWVDPEQPEKAGLAAHVGPRVPGAIVLSGHTDVVPVEGQAWSTDPFTLEERDGKYFGRGAADMKGFVALAIWAMVEARHSTLNTPLQLALSFDEEIGCTGAPPLIAEMQKLLPRGEAVIIGEPSLMRAVTAHKGIAGFDTKLRGHEVHSSLLPYGVNAVMEAAELIAWAKARNARAAGEIPSETAALFDPPFTTAHVGTIQGGTAHNITAKECTLDMTFRVVPGETVAEVTDSYKAEVARLEAEMQLVNPACAITLEPLFDVPPLTPEVDGVAEALVRSLTGDNGTHAVSFASEGGQFQAAGYSTVLCGPGDIAQAHQPDEFISKTQFQLGQDFMCDLLERLSQ